VMSLKVRRVSRHAFRATSDVLQPRLSASLFKLQSVEQDTRIDYVVRRGVVSEGTVRRAGEHAAR